MRPTFTLGMLVAAAHLAAGCFYTDPINERPGADIVRQSPANPVRGSTIVVYSNIYDADADVTTKQWEAFACADDCGETDRAPITTGGDQITFTFEVPLTLETGEPTTQVLVQLDVTDELGARAVPRQQLEIPVGNAQPTLELQKQGRTFLGFYPVNVPMTIVARKADPDDGAAGVTLEPPILYAPVGASIEDATLTMVDETASEVTWELIAELPGQWEVEVTARDPFGPMPGIVTETATIPVAEDQSPCLTVAEPGFPPDGAMIVLDELRRFAVLAVDDDLDLFPAPPVDDPYLGAAEFRWFLADPSSGGTLVALPGVDGSGVDLDPAQYTPGDQLELRVEVADRLDRPLCDGALATCEAVPGCYQRQTWLVEVR